MVLQPSASFHDSEGDKPQARAVDWVLPRASERSPPSIVNMKISDSGVAIGANPPETVSGNASITPDSRSPTCWRAQ